LKFGEIVPSEAVNVSSPSGVRSERYVKSVPISSCAARTIESSTASSSPSAVSDRAVAYSELSSRSRRIR
jgi:hypothetical protein